MADRSATPRNEAMRQKGAKERERAGHDAGKRYLRGMIEDSLGKQRVKTKI